jgi:hypothetical protein
MRPYPLLLAFSAGLLGLACSHHTAYTAIETDEVAVTAPRAPRAEPRDDRDERRARRVDTLRSAAAELDDRAQQVARISSAGAGRRGHNERELRDLTRDFARRAADLRGRLDGERVDMGDVKGDVERLDKLARKVDERLRRARAPEETYEEWDAVEATLDRMSWAALGRRTNARPREPEPGVVIPRDGYDERR